MSSIAFSVSACTTHSAFEGTPHGTRLLLLFSTTRPRSWQQHLTRPIFAEISASRFVSLCIEISFAHTLVSANTVKEVVAVAQALGHKVPDSEVDVLMARCQAHKQGLNSSMQADVANGNTTEVEGESLFFFSLSSTRSWMADGCLPSVVILGTPLREAKRLGMSVPVSRSGFYSLRKSC